MYYERLLIQAHTSMMFAWKVGWNGVCNKYENIIQGDIFWSILSLFVIRDSVPDYDFRKKLSSNLFRYQYNAKTIYCEYWFTINEA